MLSVLVLTGGSYYCDVCGEHETTTKTHCRRNNRNKLSRTVNSTCTLAGSGRRTAVAGIITCSFYLTDWTTSPPPRSRPRGPFSGPGNRTPTTEQPRYRKRGRFNIGPTPVKIEKIRGATIK